MRVTSLFNLIVMSLAAAAAPALANGFPYQESAPVQVNITVVQTFAEISVSGDVFQQSIAAGQTQIASFTVHVEANYGFQMLVQPSSGTVGGNGAFEARFNAAAPAGTTAVSVASGNQTVPLYVSVTNTHPQQARTFRVTPNPGAGETATLEVEQLNQAPGTITLTVGPSD